MLFIAIQYEDDFFRKHIFKENNCLRDEKVVCFLIFVFFQERGKFHTEISVGFTIKIIDLNLSTFFAVN